MISNKTANSQKFSISREQGLRIAKHVVVNALIPIAVYQVAQPFTSEVMALGLAAIVPSLSSVYNLIRTRKLDFTNVMVLFSLVIAIVLVLMGGDGKMLLVRQSLMTGVIGLVFVGSVLIGKPAIYYIMKLMSKGGPEEQKARIAQRLQTPGIRGRLTILSLIVGLGCLTEAVVRTVLALNLSTSTFLAVSPLVQYGLLGLTLAISVLYFRIAVKKNLR